MKAILYGLILIFSTHINANALWYINDTNLQQCVKYNRTPQSLWAEAEQNGILVDVKIKNDTEQIYIYNLLVEGRKSGTVIFTSSENTCIKLSDKYLNLSDKELDKKIAIEKEEERLAIAAKKKAERDFITLGKCEIGNSVYHRENWHTKTSSGNIFADEFFNAATRESFIITYEAVVESFLGDKVKTIINDYKVQQTIGGSILDQKTYRKYELAAHADKFIGKIQFYDKSRCLFPEKVELIDAKEE